MLMLPDDYLPHLDELNRIVKASGVAMEGNLFYYHQEPNPRRESVYSYFSLKRSNFVAAARDSTIMLEIGMNAGHSALLALACGVEYHGIDIAHHAYVRPVADYLKSQFGDRFHYYEGNSLVTVPQMGLKYPHLRFDCVHVDGNHSIKHCRQDFNNVLPLTLNNAWVIIDDTDLEPIRSFFDGEISKGTLINEQPVGWEECGFHAIGRAP